MSRGGGGLGGEGGEALEQSMLNCPLWAFLLRGGFWGKRDVILEMRYT